LANIVHVQQARPLLQVWDTFITDHS
jgi:hypothetical protein